MRAMSEMKVACTAEEAGYYSERLPIIDSFLWKLIDENKLQCASYAMARNDKIFVCKGFGKRHYREDIAENCQYNSIRRIASITKMFTAVAIMKLVEDGVIEAFSPVSTYMKEFDTKIHGDITVASLLNHTSGLRFDGESDDPYHISWWDIASQKDMKFNWIETILSIPLKNNVGVEWAYSSTGYTILGELISRVTGINVHEWIINNITKPLGMEDTSFELPSEKWDRVISTEEWNDPYKIDELKQKHLVEMEKNNRKTLDIPKTSGGMYSTPYDLLLFGQMLLNKGELNGKRILYRKTVEMMCRDSAKGAKSFCWNDKGTPKFYGLGVQLYGFNKKDMLSLSAYGHEGAGRSALYIDPEENFVAVNFVPTKESWISKSVLNLRNVMWSGII